ncbi:hypothetical protein FB565_000660 [Actinoplanes lutulentus]|uniref:WD40 repeat protein n=1 Tax=Actinoplanes lutulentus TaxID=1287878 RepID=A0A327ZLN4_9ACTN|nr:hypothetical protein [Actinoplanes lutulentus]MBB2940956.1 hypothetical protein [Actinoplanes lutulentus]RAK43265.1 hypothetical protein B0I29_101395 [Actinoplanes lutulentus]
MDRIPHDIETLIRDVAQAEPGYGGDFADIPRRARRHRNRQMTAAFAGVAAVIAVVGIGVSVNRAPDRTPVNPPAATTAAPLPTGAQRLMLNGADGSYRTFENATPIYTEFGGTQVGEFTVDSTWQMRKHQVVGADRWDRFAGLADGSIVAIGPQGSKTNLVVAGPDGTVRQTREVGKAGEKVTLVSATSEYAYLWRPSGLVEHTLNAGGERVLVTPEQLDVTDFFDGQIYGADVENGKLALTRKSNPCVVEFVALDTPSEAEMVSLDGNATCDRIISLRLSPDASEVAIAYVDDAGPEITLMDVTTGALSDGTSVDIDPYHSEDPIVAISWVDAKTLRGMAYRAIPSSDLTPFTITR